MTGLLAVLVLAPFVFFPAGAVPHLVTLACLYAAVCVVASRARRDGPHASLWVGAGLGLVVGPLTFMLCAWAFVLADAQTVPGLFWRWQPLALTALVGATSGVLLAASKRCRHRLNRPMTWTP